MRKYLILVSILFAIPAKSQTLTPRQVFEKNKQAVVRIFTNGQWRGCGFVISQDGLVATANHVVTTDESANTEPFKTIEVEWPGKKPMQYATVIDNSPRNDTALLRIVSNGLAHRIAPSSFDYVEVAGESASEQSGDAVTMVIFLPAEEFPLFITGQISGFGSHVTAYAPMNAYVVQLPIRKGFSGSPVFDSTGRAIGIVSTRLIGISPDLDKTRAILKGAKQRGNVQISVSGANLIDTILGLIDTLDADLISGLGTAVDISYAREMQNKQQKTNQPVSHKSN